MRLIALLVLAGAGMFLGACCDCAKRDIMTWDKHLVPLENNNAPMSTGTGATYDPAIHHAAP